MGGALILTVIIVIIIYIYMYHAAKRRRKRAEDIDFVKSYHENYKHSKTRKSPHNTDSGYRTFVTKYNSTEDYRERRGR